MELECDFNAIQNEDMLRRMWQQTEDTDHKKEIRSHLYKLRESRLRNLYQGDNIMSNNFAKDPLHPSHGDSLVGQNFQSLKSKEVRDSVSPTTDLKFHSMTLNQPNTTGWDVQTSSEVSPDGRAYRTNTLATTDGIEKINGGTAEFRGRNEQRASASHQGDDKNFIKKASESSDTHLQEHVVIGDENSGRSEMKTSSTTTSSSSQVTSSSSTVEYGGGEPIDAKYLVDNSNRQHTDQSHPKRLTQEQYVQQQQQRQQQLQQQEFEQTKQYQQQQHQQRVQQQQQEQRQFTEEFNRNRQESSTSRNVETQQKTEQNRRVVDVDKASPEYQQHVQYLMSQPGEIISNTVEYPKPNVKMITTVKRLPDGTIVKNKRYETEELKPTLESQRQRTTSSTSQNSTQQRTQQQNVRSNTQASNTPRQPENDVVDSAQPFARAPNQQHLVESRPTNHFADEVTNVESKFSSVKKSSRRFSTETTSETIEESSDQAPSSTVPGIRGKPSGFPSVKPHGAPQSQTPDFSTHGFPSVRPNKPTQQYPSDRPHPSDVERVTQQTLTELHKTTADAPHGFPGVRPNANITTTKDGDVIIVSSESTHSSKYKTNAERVIETEVVIDGDSNERPHPNSGFPAVKETSPGGIGSPRFGTPTREHPSGPNRSQPTEDFSTHGFPSVRSPQKQSPDFSTKGFPSARDVARPNSAYPVPSTTSNQDRNATVVTSETKKTIKHNTNREHIIETEILGDSDQHTPSGLRQPDKITFPPTPQPADFSTHGFPSVKDSVPTNDAYRRQATPTRDYPSSPRQHQPAEDFSTHGFPSVRTPSKGVPDYSTPTGGFPSTRDTNAPKLTPTPPSRPQPSTATKKSTTTTDSSQRFISKERDVDATHRAFAASLRCSSPVDSIDHHRGTPRSSVSSTRTFRRDGREGSHDSETSRISSGTVTRASPSKSVGKTVVTKQTVKTRNVNGSNETIDLTPQRHTKSPSPTKTVTTTTTRTTTTRKSPGEVPKSDNEKPKPAENTFPIINEPLTITKTHFTANDASFLGNEVVEKPCLKKHFYKLGPSDRATNNVDEKSPHSPAPSNHIHRTHPKSESQIRDDLADANHEEPIHNKPLSSSVIEPKQRNRSPSGPKSSSPQTICQPFKKEPSVERRTVVRESTFENNDWQNAILDTNEKQYPVKGDFPKSTVPKPTFAKEPNDEYTDTTFKKGSPVDTFDYPGRRDGISQQPRSKNKADFVTKTTTRIEKQEPNDTIDVTEEPAHPEIEPKQKKPLVPMGKKPKEVKPSEPLSRNVNEKQSIQPARKVSAEKRPSNNETSPTRRTSDVKTSKIFSTSTIRKTTRNENTHATDDDNLPKGTVTDKPAYKIPSQTVNPKPNNLDRSPARKSPDSTITLKTTRKQKPEPADDLHQPDEPVGRSPGGVIPDNYKQPINKTPASSSTKIIEETKSTVKTSRKDKTFSIEDDYQPDDYQPGKPSNERTVDKKKPIDNNPLGKAYPKNDRSPTRTTADTGKFKTSTITTTTTNTRKNNVSPTRKYTDNGTAEPIHKKPTNMKPSELSGTQSKGVKPKKPVDFEETQSSPEQSDNEHLTNVYEPVPKDRADENSTFITTKTRTVHVAEPQSTQQTFTDETRRVQELFNQTDKTKLTKNVNEEFITFERQVKDKVPDINRAANEPRATKPANPDYCKPIVKKPFEPFNNADKQKPEKKTITTKTSVELPKSYEPKSGKPSVSTQPEDAKPQVLQSKNVDLSDDDHFTQKTFETTTTIKDIRLTTANDKKTGISGPNNKKHSKPEGEHPKNSKPANNENDRNFETITTTTKTIVGGKPYPHNSEPFDEPTVITSNLDETKRVEALFKTASKTETIKNYNEEFIDIERENKETPDGAFFSKATESEPSSPSFKKKGVSPRETFEDRCRHILGMENYGDTPGSYKRQPDDTSDETGPLSDNITMFEVQIEDCEDEEPNYLNNIKECIKPCDKPSKYQPRKLSDEELVEEIECFRKETVVPFKRSSPERKPHNETTTKSTLIVKKGINTSEDEDLVHRTTSKVVKKTTSALPKPDKLEDVKPEKPSTSESESPENETDDDSQPDTVVSEREIQYMNEFEILERTEMNQTSKTHTKPNAGKATPNTSPTRKASEPAAGGKKSPLKQYPSGSSTVTTTTTTTSVESKPKMREPKSSPTRNVSGIKPISKSPERPETHSVGRKDKPISPIKSRTEGIQKVDSPTASDRHQKPSKESPTSTIKDRLRSSTRNKKSSTTETDSSPEMSPTRFTERRRSSNISVHTEIIIDHSVPKSPKPTEKTPERHTPRSRAKSPKSTEKTSEKPSLSPQPKNSIPTETVALTKPFRRFPVTERKESAPVPSVTRKDKDVKMTRSTSEKVMKVTEKPVKKSELSSLAPSPTPKGDRRPNKCFTTKTINLTATDKLINSEDMENIIIDIQHAKSSREPSPDKLVPTPVPVNLETGKPRYPDVVQEPEDEPRKRPVIKNIPIFEEESNEFINCHISEVKTEKISKLIDLEEDDILDNPTIEAPKSLEYPSIDRPDDDCLLSVHEKVSKFTHTAEEIKKPKASSPFSREFDKVPKVPADDECLLTVDEKVSKFIKTAEEVTKPITPVREIERPNLNDLDEELQMDDCTLTVSQKVNKFLSTAEKLAPTAPQRSPELVAKIERSISKQSEPEYREDLSDNELTPFSQNHTIEIEQRRQKDILSRPTVFENTTSTNRNTAYIEEEVTIVKSATSEPESDEVIPHTRDHTTKIELKRQKDILSRPSIYDKSAKPSPQSPTKREPAGPFRSQQSVSTKTKQTEDTKKKINSVDSEKVETKGERKPSTSTPKPEIHKSPTKSQTSSVAVTRSRFEISDKKKPTSKSAVEPKTSRVLHTSTIGRKPSNESNIPTPGTNTPYSNRRKPLNEPECKSPQIGRRKHSTEPDSHYPERKQSKESVTNVHDYETIESEAEFTSTTRRRSSSKTKDYLETVQTEIERFSPTQKEPVRKIPLQEKQKPKSSSHSPTRKDTTSTTKVTQVTERTIQHNSPSDSSDIEIVETILERPTQVKTPIPTSPVGRTRIAADTVAARRNIFENSSSPNGQRPSGTSSPSPNGRRPSYMDHTVSSLEHIRRDSLEVNKHNYSRKSSVESETNYERRPNTAVKFDVPHKPSRTASIPEDIDIENIFELEMLESLLETVTSYELRRRIRAQIRLVKKNILNTEVVDKKKTETKTSKSISSTHKTSTYTSNLHHEKTDTIEEDSKTKRPYDSKPSTKRTPQPTKSGRVNEIEELSKKSPYGRGASPKPYGKLRHDEEVTIEITTNAKTQNGRSDSPKRLTKTTHERTHSPETNSPQGSVKGLRHTAGSAQSTHKEYTRSEQTDYSEERFNSSRRVDQSSERFEKEQIRERSYSPETKSPVRDSRQSPTLKSKPAAGARTKSPDAGKPTFQRTISPQGRTPKQRDDLYSVSKVTTVKTTRSPERKPSKPTADENAPIWADRKNLLKNPSSTPRKVPAASPSTRTTATKTTTSKSTSQRQTQSRNFEEDEITSSYGIGPTDENGLPLFGIKALKKKKPSQPCEATEEVTGYVIEESYYSDNKTKPKVERKEYIYSTNADELEEIKKTVEQTRKSSKDDVDVIRKFEKIDKDYAFEKPEAKMPDSEEFITSSKYVRRGSVKELSEKFIRKESSQSVTEKSGGYPKAGLILRTSRGPSTDPNEDSYETTTEKFSTTSRSGHGYRSVERDSDDDEHNVQLRQKQTQRIFTESDANESDQCHLSTRSSTKSTRSFLNSSGENKVVTSVDDALERMRNADYVVEAGDTAEDREARSLLNKFLGASVIMKGVESVLPTTKQTTTTTITKTSYADDDDDSDLLNNKAAKTTRITKTTKSGSSSTPVTRTTCDIEEIWDEEILKELLEQATTYEERRKIRARLRDLMAEREEQKDSKSGEISENAPEVDESSDSEYEEIIEEVTVSDYSDAEADIGESDELILSQNSITNETKELEKNVENQEKETKSVDKANAASKTQTDKVAKVEQLNKNAEAKAKSKVNESVPEVQAVEKAVNGTKAKSSVDKTDSGSVDEGESLVPLLQGILQKSLPKLNANSQKTQEKSPNTELNQAAEDNRRTNKACSSSSESSALCTVNNCNKKCNLSHTDHTNTSNKNNTQTDSNKQQTHSDSDVFTNTNKTLVSKESQSTMTRDIVMNKCTGSSSSSGSAAKQKQLDRLGVPQKEDSGTESGEDLRLIAAGLRDSLHLQRDTNLIEEVTAALTRLELSLKEGKDIPVDGSKREALLALVARLQTGLSSPDAAVNLSNMVNSAGPFDVTSSVEGDAHHSNRQRFARRRNRNSRHTVGVSREELADARRYIEDMQLIGNIANCTTPESGMAANPVAPPQWFPLEKNPSTGALLSSNSSSTLYRPNQFVPEQFKNATASLSVEGQTSQREKDSSKSKRPLSGNFSVSFQPNADINDTSANTRVKHEEPSESHVDGSISPDSSFKSNRFSNKKQLMKRANTIDIPKSKKYDPDFDTDSEPEDQAPPLGLKRTVQVNVKHKVRSVIPPFVPKTENDHKFLAFINKQSAKPGLGWTGARSVSNWTNKFGNLKHTFEVGAAAQVTTGKPPQAPGHVPHSAAKNYWQKQVAAQDYQQQYLEYQQQQHQQEQLQRNHEAKERQRRVERERLERERIERDRLERQRLERQRQERDRIEREYYEREIMEQDRLAAAQHAAMPSMKVANPAPVNQFQHAPQSVFRPIDNKETHSHSIFKPIPQLPHKLNTWQPPSISNNPHSAPAQISPASPQFLTTKQSANGPCVSSPSSTASSPIVLPWVAKPAVDNSDFRKKAHTFEERSQNDNRQNSYLQRHHSLRSPKAPLQTLDDYKKRPSLPSTADPNMAAQSQYVPQQPHIYASTTDVYAQPPPPPTNISFTYADLARTSNFKSYPCLPSAVETSITADYVRQRESSLTDPNATPLILTSSNPTYGPSAGTGTYHNNIPTAKQFDYASPMDSAPTSPSILAMPQTYYTDDDLDSDNLMEYRAETRVMAKPQCQTAVTVRDRRTAHASDDEVFGKNSRNAQKLLHTMRNIGKNGNEVAKAKKEPARKVESPNVCLSPDGRAYQAPIVEPLFPELTKFEPNRAPEYIENTKRSQTEVNHKKSRPKTPLKPNQKTERSLQSARAEEKYRAEQQKYEEKSKYANVSETTKEQQQVQYQMTSMSNGSSTSSVPYISETQTAYVVTYPTEDVYNNDCGVQHPNSLPLQRNRNISENSSASSSISHNLPSPGTSWVPNPIHAVKEEFPQHKSHKTVTTNNLPPSTYQPQAQAQANSQSSNSVKSVPQSKPNVAPKPSAASAQCKPAPQSQPAYQQPYTPTPNSKPAPQPPTQTKSSNQERQRQLPVQTSQPHVKAAPKLTTRSQKTTSTWQSQSFDLPPQLQQMALPRQRAFDAAIAPLAAQNRVLSQKSLVSSKQRQFEQHEHEHEQQHLTEIRRKSLGNVFDVHQQQRQAAYIMSDTKTVVKQEYKSSAPPDTPDIVKSSLPKEDMPILKKFGPPQRHHYVPNSYQSPVTNKQSQKFESSTKVIKSTQHEIVQHSTLTKKPSIVEIPATPQPDEDLIPRNIVFNNISAFTFMSRRQEDNGIAHVEAHPRTNRLSKSDSWNQIVQIQNQKNAQLPPTSPKFGSSGGSGSELRRTKSGHTLNVRMYEAGIDKAKVGEKQRTVEAYFTGKKSPNQFDGETVEMRTATTASTTTTSTTAATKKSAINRHKTSEKISASRKSLTTMTSNGTSAATTVLGEQQAATSTTEKTETTEKDGAVVTTTTKVTTRTVSGAGSTAAKPVSPFAKFRQLDKQNSQQSTKSPSTPTTPGGTASPSGSARIFQFTDPALNARAATVKDQLLQWCQSKTQEYENVQITNFSASWSDGLAFCALIHHFLPDAFDYNKLTPKSRRQNFEIAFTVADEKAGIAPLLDVEDMVEMKRPDWKCVFIYVQSIYRRFRNCQ